MRLPSRLNSYRDFDAAVLSARQQCTSTGPRFDRENFLNSMYYLLGWFLGDLGKQFGSIRLTTAGLNLTLTKRHPENQALGDVVFFQCVQTLGIQARRQPDREPDRSSQYGAYRWDCRRSPLFGWFHLVCLGLEWEQRASSDPVRMDWILGAPSRRRLWFIRGVADSDGDVHFNDRSVGITTTPNTALLFALLESVGCTPRAEVDGRSNKVVITVKHAAQIEIFNPRLLTYRRRTLVSLATAKTFERRWPAWLQDEVTTLLNSGAGAREIRDKVLEDHHVFIRLATLRRKRLEANPSQKVPREGFAPSTSGPGGNAPPRVPQITLPSPGL